MKCKLSDLCEYVKAKTEVSTLDDTTYISTENMIPYKGGITIAASLPNTTQTQAYSAKDTLVSNIRPYFKKIWYAQTDGGCSNDVLVFRPKKKVNSRFLYYLLSDDAFFYYATATAKGTKMPRGDKKAILEYPVPNISGESQCKIADILSGIDDKITLNQQINKNLEELAKTIVLNYCETIAQFIFLRDIMSFENGFAFQSATYLPIGKYRIITIKNVLDGRIDSQGSSCIDIPPSRMKSGCYLAIGDVLLSLTGNVGRVGIVCEDHLLLNQRVAKFQPKISSLLPWLYYYFRLPRTKTSLETIAKGTAQANLSPIETLNLLIPFELHSALEVSKLLQDMFDQEILNNMESIRLAALRDTLLPRLMSGELDMSKVEISI